MAGQFLNNYFKWINEFIKSNDVFIDDDIDWFIEPIRKKEWLLLGFSLWSLTKDILKNNGFNYLVEITFTLGTINTSGRIPKKLTDQLFRNVMTPPTISITKKADYITNCFMRPDSNFVEIKAKDLNVPFDCCVFFNEEKDIDSDGVHYSRYLHFI